MLNSDAALWALAHAAMPTHLPMHMPTPSAHRRRCSVGSRPCCHAHAPAHAHAPLVFSRHFWLPTKFHDSITSRRDLRWQSKGVGLANQRFIYLDLGKGLAMHV